MHTDLANSENKKQSVANRLRDNAHSEKPAFEIIDNRPGSAIQRKQLEALANYTAQPLIQKKANSTGLPDNLKSGIENLSGQSMDDVKVHYNSSQPAQLNAHAYAQGTNIHLASGQEKHLPHEAWHVVQQKQGRVKPTMQMKGKANLNDDKGLEKEADVMGAKAIQFSTVVHQELTGSGFSSVLSEQKSDSANKIVQRVIRMRAGADGQWGYYSDRDPDDILYPTEHAALAAEQVLGARANPPNYGPGLRPPTFFSYAHARPHNKIGSTSQGPHVVGYAAVDTAVNESTHDIAKIFTEQVRTPEQVEAHIREKAAALVGTRRFEERIHRFMYDYRSTYNHVRSILKSGSRAEILNEIKWLINADPISSTNWLGKLRSELYRVPQAKLKHKAETSDLRDRKNVDTISGGASAASLYERRLKLLPAAAGAEEEKGGEEAKFAKRHRVEPAAASAAAAEPGEEEAHRDRRQRLAPTAAAAAAPRIIDTATVYGTTYAINDPRIGNAGQCLWDTLLHHGIGPVTLAAAAAARGLAVNAHVLEEQVWPLIQEINNLTHRNYGLIIDRFNILTNLPIRQLRHDNTGSIIRIGFAVNLEDGQGHFIPPHL